MAHRSPQRVSASIHRLVTAGAAAQTARPLWLATEATLPALLEQLDAAGRQWLRSQQYQAERGRVLLIPGPDGAPVGAVAGLGAPAAEAAPGLWDAAAWPDRLCGGTWVLAAPLEARTATQVALGWLLGGYRYAGERVTPPRALPGATLLAPEHADLGYAQAASRAIARARDLINAPANQLGPEELAAAAAALAGESGGSVHVYEGEALRHGFPLIHAVGSGSARAPRLIDCRWPRSGAPRVVLVGKGVCFDSGGLDIKPASAMLLMKKDMGGAACALALAQLLLEMAAPLDLRLLIPAVENSVGSRAYRPGDVWKSRKGLTVEVGNTDAEGRLVLADALAAAEENPPDLLIDLATLTGAARTALGPDLPAAFGSSDALLAELRACGEQESDPLWPLPLWLPYDEDLASRVADVGNVSANAFAGAIYGALFLRRFVTASPAWLHLDLYAWNPRDRPGRPLGGEAQCVRALYRLIRRRCG
ncbi:MAG: leucyl aminopeptidase family protein [Gammaproteobacteria bacterium]|nr:leucyl aminopeptidase family protein [Gammaproteobacteria bacterium]